MMKLDISSQSPRRTANGTSTSLSSSGASKSQRGPPTRPLGSVRQSSLTDNVTKFPPLTGPSPRLDGTYSGITGSAMSVPPPKPVAERQVTERPQPVLEKEKPLDVATRRGSSPRKTVSSVGSAASDHSKKTDDSLREKDKELQLAMGRERELKQQIMQLQKIIDELKQQLRDKEKTIEQLKEQFARQEEFYKEQYEKECSRHKETQDFLHGVKDNLTKVQKAKEQQKEDYEKKLEELTTTMNTRLLDLANEKDKEIKTRDEKLNKLKKQMADALKGNSWERQQQLDELSKELTKVQEEAELLKMKLRSMSKGGGGGGGGGKGVPCVNCDAMRIQVSASQNVVKDKDQEISKLKVLSSKLEKQLAQQDILLKQFADSKGYKGK